MLQEMSLKVSESSVAGVQLLLPTRVAGCYWELSSVMQMLRTVRAVVQFSLFLTGEGHTCFECSNILISGSCSFSCTKFRSQIAEAQVFVCPVAKQGILQARKGSK